MQYATSDVGTCVAQMYTVIRNLSRVLYHNSAAVPVSYQY
jgi:hypothetical protein